MNEPPTARNRFWKVWSMPAWLAAATMIGLGAALRGTGAWHWTAWGLLSLPLAVGLWHGLAGSR